MEEFQRIPVAEINTAGQMIREEKDQDHVAELALNIAKNGLLQPIVVNKNDNNGYQLIAGFHRLIAVKNLGWETVPAHVRKKDDTPIKALALTENIIRRNLSLIEECQAVDHLHTEQKLSASQICDLLKKSRAWVDRRLAAPNFPDEIRSALWNEAINLSVAELIAGVKDNGIRNTILNQAICTNLTAAQVQSLIKAYDQESNLADAIRAGEESAKEVQTPQERIQRCMSCQEVKRMSQLTPVWICLGGCQPRKEEHAEESREEDPQPVTK